MSEETKEIENNDVIIYSDSREDGTAVVKILSKRCDLRQKQLVVADYQLSENVGLERKSQNDFLQSIVDGRLFQQLGELKRVFSCPILLIEGDGDMFGIRDIHPNAIRGALASIATDFKVPILWSTTQIETAELLYVIAKREQMQLKHNTTLRVRPKFRSINQEQEFVVAGLPNISTVKAKNLLKHFQTPQKLFAASEDELQKVDGIGPLLAKKIYRLITRKYEKSILGT
jgi:Fanconi anemia group M protein